MKLIASLALEIGALIVLGMIFYWYGKRKIIKKFFEEGEGLKQYINELNPNNKNEEFFKNPIGNKIQTNNEELKEAIDKYKNWYKEKIKANL